MMTDLTMGPLTPVDEPILWKILYHALFASSPRAPFTADIVHNPELSHYVERWGRAGDTGILVCYREDIIGAAWLRFLTGSMRGYGYINDLTPELAMAVLPDYRSRGVGTQLLAVLLEEASSLFPAVSLSVASNNPAERLYLRFGFQLAEDYGSSKTM